MPHTDWLTPWTMPAHPVLSRWINIIHELHGADRDAQQTSIHWPFVVVIAALAVIGRESGEWGVSERVADDCSNRFSLKT